MAGEKSRHKIVSNYGLPFLAPRIMVRRAQTKGDQLHPKILNRIASLCLRFFGQLFESAFE